MALAGNCLQSRVDRPLDLLARGLWMLLGSCRASNAHPVQRVESVSRSRPPLLPADAFPYRQLHAPVHLCARREPLWCVPRVSGDITRYHASDSLRAANALINGGRGKGADAP